MFIKKRYILLILLSVVLLIAGLFYFREFRSLPDFSVHLMPDIEVPGKDQTVVIFSPHNDDETIGAGGFIDRSIKNGAKVIVVFITNGDGHVFSTMEDFRKVYPSAQNYIDSGYQRQGESEAALSILGVDSKDIIFLGYPDHGIKQLYDKNWKVAYESPYTKKSASPYPNSYTKNVSYTGENLESDILKILEKHKPSVVVSSYQFDQHTDHVATYNFVKKTIHDWPDSTVKNKYYYLVHYRQFPYPSGLRKDRFIAPPAKLVNIDVEWEKLSLTIEELQLKEQALLQYKSQLDVPTLKKLVDSFIRQNELFAVENETTEQTD